MTTLTPAQMQAMFAEQFGGASAQPPQQQADRFAQLMAHAQPHAHVDHAHNENFVTKAVMAQDAAFQQVPNDLLYMMQNMPSLANESPTEAMNQITNESIITSLESASLTANLQIKMAVVTSSKDAVQTLMKNQ